MPGESKQLQPVSRRETSLNDLLDRLLTKGLMLNSDVVVTLSGIPLLGLNLRLALAGMSTMLRYGFMTDWDAAIRSLVQKERAGEGPRLEDGERVLFSHFGSCWYSRGIYSAWRPGLIYLTDRRLFLYRQGPGEEVLLDLSLGLVRAVDARQVPHFSGRERQEIWLTLTSGDVARLHSAGGGQLLAALENARSLAAAKKIEFPGPGDREEIWFLKPDGSDKYAWLSGTFSVLDGGLCWRGGSRQGQSFRVAAADVLAVELVVKDTLNSPGGRTVMEVRYLDRLNPKKAYFAGEIEALRPWASLLREARRDILETCPACGAPAPAGRLLNKGCAACAWISARLKRRLP